ncbi:hypothetical protein QBC47DRAFT_349568 [Echria macrotheca]|uniref:Tyrosinase copper-binding domain-containing protein n=1 Tax=Echria macrotheca TaxID=438768 RepID=A0AAJ0F3X3_9PEZI|nr:hypothetical protein QBC47DRAFT_349568 [Echria macrotheca]
MASSFLRRALVVLVLCGTALGVPVDSASQAVVDVDECTSPRVRRSWFVFSDAEKKAYLDAEVCLMSTPTTLKIRGARTKFDDFQAAHALKMEIAHFVGQFLPFHRLFVWAHEQALQNECGYTGAQPFWDETLDVGKFSKSIVLDPVLGFGGDGTGPGGCIQTGPFANYVNPIGPGYPINDHCIDRQIADGASVLAAQALLDSCHNTTSFLAFWPCIEGGPHGAGHAGIGAEMLNPISSPGDPIFYLHHTWLDRLWAKWQLVDPEVRLKDIGGNNRMNLGNWMGGGAPAGGGGGGGGGGSFVPVNLTRPWDVPEPKVVGDPGSNTTLNHLIYLYGLAPNKTIAEVMDTKGFLCYVYD